MNVCIIDSDAEKEYFTAAANGLYIFRSSITTSITTE